MMSALYKAPVPPSCHVFLGARNLERGEAAVKKILDDFPDAAGKIEVLQIDVTDDASCAAAAAAHFPPLAARSGAPSSELIV